MPQSDPNNFELIRWLWGLLVFPLGYLFKKTGDNSKEISTHRQHIAENYVRKEDFREDMRGIKSDLKTIIDKLDRKADK